MAEIEPLSATEHAFWRSLMRIVLAFPHRLDRDLLGSVDITGNEYITLMSLSEAPGLELRMTELAHAAGLSASRMTRLIDGLQSRGLVSKETSALDRRGNVASLTPAGRAKLETAWAVHLLSARDLVFDHVDPATVGLVARTLSELAAQLEARP